MLRASHAARQVFAKVTTGVRSHQRASGRWTAGSLGENREPNSDPARFVHHAVTACAVPALTD